MVTWNQGYPHLRKGVFEMKFTFAEKKMDSSEDLRAYATTIERQIRRNKTRLEKRLREGALEKDAAASAPYEAAAAAEEPADEFRIVRSKRFSIKPMSAEEAILQMNLLDHEFFVFRNMDADDAIAVVYKRRQGGYGLICDDGLDED